MQGKRGAFARAVFGIIVVGSAVASLMGAPSASAGPAINPTEDDSRRIAFDGRWTYSWDSAHSGHSARSTGTRGASATMRFTGSGVGLVAPKGPAGGIAEIRLDGLTVATVSLFSAEPTTGALVWWSGDLPTGTHSVRVVASGERETLSSGTEIVVDRFDVAGGAEIVRAKSVIQSDDERIRRVGDWRKRVATGASKASSRRSSKPGSSLKLTFRGTSVSWIGGKSAEHGLAEVLLDGRRVATVGGAPGDLREKTVLWSASGLANSRHTLEIRALGQPGLATGSAVDVDAFLIDGAPLFTPRPTPFKYPWKTYIVVDKSRFRLYWVKDRVLVKSYPIAHGRKWGYTPPRVWRIDAKYRSTGVYGPRKMRLFKRVSTRSGNRYVFTAYAIHGTNNAASIGTMASAGCIRMYNRDVLDLFPRVPVGTMVVTRD